ncbi:class I SAM-dependent methyltransferase, partial [Streptomyces phytophilus]|uniref:class I SAM-dependent methyltransferase n=1 Tax=Streptomyces phytophilus TaxID=722715 RepID=UPI0015F0CC06
MGEDLSAAAAKGWAVRWELQREQREPGREDRFTVVGDLVERVTDGRHRPAVLDLGCGTGSLAARLKRRMPALDVVAVDADPVLLGLGRRMHGTQIRFVDTVVGGIRWQDDLDLDRPLDAAVSATMLHRLPERMLLEVYGRLHALLRP